MEKEVIVDDQVDRLVFIIPRQVNELAVVLTGLWILGYLGILVTVISGQIQDRRFILELNFFMLFFGAVCLMAAKIFLWNIRGKEKITLTSEFLVVEKVGTFLTLPKKYETNLIEGFVVVAEQNWSISGNVYGFSGGQVSFDYWTKPTYFGQTLSKKQAIKIVERLNIRLKNNGATSLERHH